MTVLKKQLYIPYNIGVICYFGNQTCKFDSKKIQHLNTFCSNGQNIHYRNVPHQINDTIWMYNHYHNSCRKRFISIVIKFCNIFKKISFITPFHSICKTFWFISWTSSLYTLPKSWFLFT